MDYCIFAHPLALFILEDTREATARSFVIRGRSKNWMELILQYVNRYQYHITNNSSSPKSVFPMANQVLCGQHVASFLFVIVLFLLDEVHLF